MMSNPLCHLLPLVAILTVCTGTAFASDPQDLAALRQSYEAAVKRATQPLQEGYERKLKELIDRYTRVGDLDAALAAKTELEKSQTPQATGNPRAVAVTSFAGGREWEQQGGEQWSFKFEPNGSGIMSRKKTGETVPFGWTLNGEEVVVSSTVAGREQKKYFMFESRRDGRFGNYSGSYHATIQR